MISFPNSYYDRIKWSELFDGKEDKERWTEIAGLLPLHGGGGFGGDVVQNAVDALYLIDDAHGSPVKHFIGNACPFRSHEVVRDDAAENHRGIVSAAVTHHTDGMHV